MGKKSSADIREQLLEELKEDIDNQPLLSEAQFQAALHGEGDYSETSLRKTQIFKDLNLTEYDGEDATALLNQLTLGKSLGER
ncbi:hypothetical protein [Candidatus Hamiltonella defensa]|uniref:hypothetical protein n=1 Tax=Candidatus Williamhamiltonella defendens TaxID=138072 RepID=UPI001930F030|nr:hypothetical protein [Candidatus Hamiltonella defensa]